jgi:hypothetical protein
MRHGICFATSLLLLYGAAEAATPAIAPTRSLDPPKTLSVSRQQLLAKSLNIVVTAPVAATNQAVSTSQLAGQLHAPVGARVVLQLNGGTERISRIVAPNISGDANGAQDAFVVDTGTGAVERVSVGTPAGNVILRNRVTGETRGVSRQKGNSVGVPA